MQLAPASRTKRAKGDVCCEPVVFPEIDVDRAQRVAAVGKALGDPIRVQLLDVLRRHAGEVCVCELVPLFDVSQPTVSHHLKVLRDAGLVTSQKQGLWVFYRVLPEALDDLATWLADP
jgi:ArsR family transcriptional regulator